MTKLEFKNVYKSYDKDKFVIKDISFTINDNDFLILLGSSGCGKTTILNLIAGLEEVTKGEIYINSLLVNNVEPKDRDVAMIFQNYALYPHMNVYDNIAFSLRNKKVDEQTINNKIIEVSKTLKIEELLYKKPNKISGGQKQRVSIARAIIREPKIFLMDEPLSSLDVSLRNEMREELKKLHNKLNKTIVYVTHDQIEALTLGTKIIVIEEGKIFQVGTPKEIYERPSNEFVAQFIGAPKMNIIKDLKINYKNKEKYIVFFDKKIKINTNIEANSLDIGIRAEHLFFDNRNRDIKINSSIDYYELIGSEYIVHGKTNYGDLIYKLPSTFNIDDKKTISLSLSIEKIHLFDNITKERIYL